MYLRALYIVLLILSCNPGEAKNVILFVGDGMGISTVTAARIFAGQQLGNSGEEHQLSFDKFANVALIKTYNTDAQVPDSAGTITALLNGQKTRIGVLGVNANVPRDDCSLALRNEIPSLVELAEEMGKQTGIVSTARITHATPAGAYAHSPNRNWENNSEVPQSAQQAGCQDIALQMLQFPHGDGVDVILGGGRAQFTHTLQPDPEYPDKTGLRTDSRDLVNEWRNVSKLRRYAWNTAGFTQWQDSPARQFLGLFEPSHMQFEADRATDPGGEPSLTEMTRFAIAKLSRHGAGFFLLVEAGRIDHAHHFSNAYRALVDTVELDRAVAAAQSMTQAEETLILVTADHSHTFTISGYPSRGNPILGKVDQNTDQAYTTLGYANGPGYQTPYPDLSGVDTQAPNYRQIAAVPLAAETHSGEDVAAFANGRNAAAVRGVMEQNELFKVMHTALFGEE